MVRRALPTLLTALLLLPVSARGDAGVLIPSGSNQPDPKILSLREMKVEIVIDNGTAKVSILQIFSSHVQRVLEGNYIFALPERAAISNFALWDGLTRIPGVILERKRAREIYESLVTQRIDPGLLQMGEHTAGEARRTAVFSARIFPIPGYGTKRLEMEYHQTIPVENLESFFALPLRPDSYQALAAEEMEIRFELRSEHAVRVFQQVHTTFPLQIDERTPNRVRGSFRGRNVSFTEDFAIKFSLEDSKGDNLKVITFRDPDSHTPDPTAVRQESAKNDPGFFQASTLLTSASGPRSAPGRTSGGPRTVVALLDTSLSMQWEKLERSFQTLETLLRSLRPEDRFNLVLFNNAAQLFAPAPVTARLNNVEKALALVRSSFLRGGTNLEAALDTGLKQFVRSAGDPYLVLISDGGPTRGAINSGKLTAWYAKRWLQLPATRRPHTYIFAVGDDANLPLLRMLARDRGILEWVRSTEPIEFKLNAFLSKIGRRPVAGLGLTVAPESNFDMIYPLADSWFAGAAASWVGQFKAPLRSAEFAARGVQEGSTLSMRTTAALPEKNLEHPHLPRTWAKARVDALLEKIEREGEDEATVDEIIRLARKYKFVTPYTSFLAVPRALLRPRVIRPGDPVLRVRTDESIASVVALFPFGLVKKLRYLPGEDIWQTRFLAPADMEDGTHKVRLILRDREGHVYREAKSFVIASKPPLVRVRLEKKRFRAGETVALRVAASETTRTIVARMYGVAPVSVRWDPKAKANTGQFTIPAALPPGRYQLRVTAEDFAHNIGSQEVWIEVVP